MASIEIPDKDQDIFLTLLRLGNDDAFKLLAQLNGSDGRYASLAVLLHEHMAEDNYSGKEILRALIALVTVQKNHNVSSVEMVEALSKAAGVNPSSSALRDILDSPMLARSAKAMNLRNAYERIYVSSRLVTDIRPVFPDEPVGDLITAALVNHSLQLNMKSGDKNTESVFISVDAEDLEDLRKQIDRALAKEKAARTMIRSANAVVLEPLEATE